MDLGLADRVYIVSGGSRGLGRASAAALVDEDARVVISARSEEAVTETVNAFGRDAALGVPADLASTQTANTLVDAAQQGFGRLDGALISVGGPAPGAVLDVDDDAWRSSFESVFLGAVRLARTVVPHLSDGGSILFVLSTSVLAPIPGLAASNGLRPGLAMVAKQLADELGPSGIRVNGLLPGRIDTDRVRELDAVDGDPAAARALREESIPLRRYGRPEEIGRTAAFMLSPVASYLTGTMVAVDGGSTRAL